MANALIHSQSSVKLYGGVVDDYIHLHNKMDCSKGYFPDNRHRVLTHTMFWIKEVMEPLFGLYITNSEGKNVSVKDICERHILEDYRMKFIPTPQDFIQHMPLKKWMQNGQGETPTSCAELYKKKEVEVEYPD